MCGIVGYIGQKSALEPVIEGLYALEYRGYDSAGVSLSSKNGISTIKEAGSVDALVRKTETTSNEKAAAAIGHTRWATHGAATSMNAHPHQNNDNDIAVVHNGIIENYEFLKQKLEAEGYVFVSETDTEVIPHLIDFHMRQVSSFFEAFKAAVKELRGAYAICAMHADTPAKIYAARLSSPLIIGVGMSQNFIASDAAAITKHTKRVVYLEDYDVVELSKKTYKIENIAGGGSVKRATTDIDYELEQVTLGNYPHYMLKEIHEAPHTIKSATRGRVRPDSNTIRLGGLDNVSKQLQFIDKIIIVACGTSYYAGLVGEYLIEELAGIPVEVQFASEFKYRNEPFSGGTALLAISQSGETADTIAALKKVEGYGMLRLGVVNTVGSTIARITDAGVYCHAGPERSVASTKAFIAQVIVLTEIALHLSKGHSKHFESTLQGLTELPEKVEQILSQEKDIKNIAERYSGYDHMLYIGRGYAFPCALEGALKLKEVSYIHAEGHAAGEMKHGPLALIDKNFPTLAIATDNPYLEKTLSNIQEIKARQGPVIAIATKGNKQIARHANDVIYLPKTLNQLQPILVAVALQLFAYHIAVKKDLNVDRPRNLAKSVTVE